MIILSTKHLELKTLTMPQIMTYTVPRTNIKFEYTDRHAKSSQGGHSKTYNHTWCKYLWETLLETTERYRDKRLPMVKKECAIHAKGNMYDMMCERNGEQDKGERAIEIHWMTTFEFRDLFRFISEKVMIQLGEHSTSVECRCLTLCVCVCVLVDSFFLGVETPRNKF